MYEQARVQLHEFDDSVGLVGMGSFNKEKMFEISSKQFFLNMSFLN